MPATRWCFPADRPRTSLDLDGTRIRRGGPSIDGLARVRQSGSESCARPLGLTRRPEEPPVPKSILVAGALCIASGPLRAEVTKVDVASLEQLREAEVPVIDIPTPEEQGGNGSTATGLSR